MTEPATDYAALFGRNLRAARLRAGLKMVDLTSTAPVLSCRSPAGGVVFLDAIYMGLLKRAVAH